jgi:hypothetical protein
MSVGLSPISSRSKILTKTPTVQLNA